MIATITPTSVLISWSQTVTHRMHNSLALRDYLSTILPRFINIATIFVMSGMFVSLAIAS